MNKNNYIALGKKNVGHTYPTYLIAEIGVNHG